MIDPSNHAQRYYAYFHYLVGTSRLIKKLYPAPIDLAKEVVSLKGYKRLKGNSSANFRRVSELLHNSWFTRVQLAEVGKHEDLIPLNSPWSLVQAYYAIYSASRAYLLAQGRETNANHAATLDSIVNDLNMPSSRFPLPWNCVFCGNPQDTSFTLTNAPDVKIEISNPLVSLYKQDRWQHFGLFLKTTRKKQLNASIAGWKQEQKRKNIRAAEREVVLSKLRPTSIFDALYRVRTRSNYQDIDSFAFGVSTIGFSSEDVRTFHEAIELITDTTLLVFEILMAKILKKKWLLHEMESFTSSAFVHPHRDILMKHCKLIADVV